MSKGDANGDDVFDDLGRDIARKAPDEPVRVIVTLEAPASQARVRRIERRVGAFSVRNRFRVVDAFSARVKAKQVRELAARPEVAAVESDGTVRALDASGQAAFGVAEARRDNPSLDGNRDGNPSRYSRGDMVAAVLDTGIDRGHRDLDEGKVLAFANCVSGRCYGRAPFDNHGHGTHVAATLAGEGDARTDRRYRGVAWRGALVGVKVLGSDGTAPKSAVIAGVDWAVANRGRLGIEAVNLSIGGGGCSDGTDAMSRAANRANSAGLITVAAAGNDGPARCTINSPAAAAGALAVGAMADVANGGLLADWRSSRGAPGGRIKPEVMGPGVHVISARAGTTTGYWRKTGTSMAAPFVTGVALLMRDARPSLGASEIKARLRSTAVDWGLRDSGLTFGSRGPDLDFGWGRLDAYRALRAAGASGLDGPPPVPTHRVLEGTFTASVRKREFPLEIRNRCLPIAGSLIMPRWNGYTGSYDFDFFLRDPSGRRIAWGDSIERQDDLDSKPSTRSDIESPRPAETGTYTVEVEAIEGSGNYFIDVSAGLSDPPPGSPASCGPPAESALSEPSPPSP